MVITAFGLLIYCVKSYQISGVKHIFSENGEIFYG